MNENEGHTVCVVLIGNSAHLHLPRNTLNKLRRAPVKRSLGDLVCRISTLTAALSSHLLSSFFHSHSLTTIDYRIPPAHPSSNFNKSTSIPLAFPTSFSNPQSSQKCLQKLQQRLLPLVARPQLARHPRRRRRLARRLLRLRERRRSAPRPEKRPTPRTSTKVFVFHHGRVVGFQSPSALSEKIQITNAFLHLCSSEASPPRHWYFQPCHVHPKLFRQR